MVILIGLLGGFTTFSSYGLQTFTLLRDGEFGLGILNVITSNILVCLWCGAGTFWAESCEGNYDYSRGRLSVANLRG
jgi:fluoride exporter